MKRLALPGLVLLIAAVVGWPFPRASEGAKEKEADRVKKALELSAKIDAELRGKADKPDLAPAPRSTDAEFFRRVSLDLTGAIPTETQTRAFLAESSPTKRQEAVEKLLASEAYGDVWSRIWLEILFGNYRDLQANVAGKNVPYPVLINAVSKFRESLKSRLNEDASLQTIVMEILASSGRMSDNPSVVYKISFYRDGEYYLNLADNMSKSLLGVQVGCARCHDHPFDRWTQDDYFGLAAFFVRIWAKPIGGKRPDTCDDVEVLEARPGDYKATGTGKGGMMGKEDKEDKEPPPMLDLTMPGTKTVVAPRFLGGRPVGANDPRLPQLVQRLTTNYAQLPRNVVNRTWARLMGRGFVDPVDGFNQKNKPVHGELLETMTKALAQNGMSLKYLLRAICNSESYQRASSGGGKEPFMTAPVQPLTGEQLFKSLVTAVYGGEKPVDFQQKPVQDAWGGFFDQLVPLYGADKTWTEVTLLPNNTRLALLLRNGDLLNHVVQDQGGIMDKLDRAKIGSAEKIDRLYMAALCRPPTPDEAARCLAYVQKLGGQRAAYEDVLWSLLNSTEFCTRH